MCDTGVKRMHCITGGIFIGITLIYIVALTAVFYSKKADEALKISDDLIL